MARPGKARHVKAGRLLVNIPEYITPAILHDRLSYAGRLVGIADFRPSYGRFQVSHFDIGLDAK